MKRNMVKKIEQEINQKTTIPDNLKNTIRKEIFTNIVIAIAVIIYFTFLIAGSIGATKTVRTTDFNIFSIIILCLAIYLFEVSYRKENAKLAIFGIESLAGAIITLFLPYIIFELDEFHKKYYMIMSIYISAYYIIKSICISLKAKKNYIKQASDIKELVKKEKKKDLEIKEREMQKTTKENRTENTEFKGKETMQNNKNTPKKRGRPKKQETTDKENKKTEENVPKKRGRPRKVVTKDD